MTGSIHAGPTVLCSGGALAEAVGIEVLGGMMTVLLEAGSPLPLERTELFSTASDGQPVITVRLLAGSAVEAEQNRSLGAVEVSGFAARPRGVPQVEIGFRVELDQGYRDTSEARLIITATEGGAALDVHWQR